MSNINTHSFPGDHTLTATDVNRLIELLIGDDTPLHAIEQNDEVYLLNRGEDVNEGTKLTNEDLTRQEMPKILYDYAVHFGYTNEDFGDFVGA